MKTRIDLYDDDGLPVGYELEQLFGLEAAYDE